MSRPTEAHSSDRARDPAAPVPRLPRDLGVALGAALVVGLGAGSGFLLDGRDGALTGTILGFSACVLAFTLTTVLWAMGAATRWREAARRPR